MNFGRKWFVTALLLAGLNSASIAGDLGTCVDLSDPVSLAMNSYRPEILEPRGQQIWGSLREPTDYSYFITSDCGQPGCYIRGKRADIPISYRKVFETQGYSNEALGIKAIYGMFYVRADGPNLEAPRRTYFYYAEPYHANGETRTRYGIVEFENGEVPAEVRNCLG
ncbi:hypothetical protein [Rhizobium sp. LjRoot254]|uniref:hypothetical protein n=1 Tax=Rhizobium sp. LjRoot254 TaxID=3342297 RepID=UPI003ED0C8F7